MYLETGRFSEEARFDSRIIDWEVESWIFMDVVRVDLGLWMLFDTILFRYSFARLDFLIAAPPFDSSVNFHYHYSQ